MTLRRSLRSAAVVTATVLAGAGAVAVAGPALAQPAGGPVAPQPFYADSGDSCPMGYTKGTLDWQLFGPGFRWTVKADGAVVDRPRGDETDRTCTDDRRYTEATVTAYTGGFPVATATQVADNGQTDFVTSLTAPRRIDRVVVQVCRKHLFPGPFEYCGKPQEYRSPFTTG
jgi:hypothetical protein